MLRTSKIELSRQIDEGILQINQLLDKLSNASFKSKINSAARQEIEFESLINDEEILLDNCFSYNSHFVQNIYLPHPLCFNIEMQQNWIQKFLDYQDCKVNINNINILKFVDSTFICKTQQGEQVIPSKNIYNHKSLSVSFPFHNQGYELKMVDQYQQQYIYELNIQEETRIIVRTTDTITNHMQRIIILKKQGQNYQVHWGFYANQQIVEPVLLSPSIYLIISLSSFPLSRLQIIYKQDLAIRIAKVNSFSLFNILSKTFRECYNNEEDDRNKQFTRLNYMDLGLILQIYQNRHNQPAKFVDKQPVQQDKKLLFKQIYTIQQVTNRLDPLQKIIKFYEITTKPAHLYLPQKLIIVSGKPIDGLTFHTVFK